MSIVRVDTNVAASDIDDAFLEKSTESLAKTFQKDKSVSTYIYFKICTFQKISILIRKLIN